MTGIKQTATQVAASIPPIPRPVTIRQIDKVTRPVAVVAMIMLLRKRYDSNLPLLFYVVAIVFSRLFDRPVNPFVMYGGLAFALLLRFEFMGGPILIAVRTVELICLGYYIWVCLGIVFGW